MTLGKNKKSFNIILDRDVKKEIDRIANEESRSSSGLINYILKQYIKVEKRKSKLK